MTITTAALEAACKRRGLVIKVQYFDCGETVRVHDGHILIAAVTRECGDIEPAPEAVAEWLLTRGLLAPQDFTDAPANPT